MTTNPIPIRSAPGIRRDGTRFDRKNYSDGVWCRFQRGLPRKMGGYSSITSGLDQRVYGMGSFAGDSFNYISMGMASKIVQAQIDSSTGSFSALVDRTPVGFTSDTSNVAQFSLLPSAVAPAADLIAHSAPNLTNLASLTERPIYYGQANLATALVATGLDSVSGGATVLGPYVFGYGNSGQIVYSQANTPATQLNAAYVTGQKIVYGRPLRGGGSGPSGIFWSLDAIVRATFVGGSANFAFDELATELSILSSRSVVEYNGVFYWWDVSGPLMFNGVVRETPNDMNLNYLLDNLNYDYRQKMFAMKNPRWGEIWWCVPLFGATECNWAIILNVREGTWYDTPLPDFGRTSGIWPQAFRRPLMTDNFETDTGFSLWQQEIGTDRLSATSVEPIPSSFTTSDLSPITGEGAVDKSLRVEVIEPDFVQSGDMIVEIIGHANARSPDITSAPKTFVEDNGNLSAEEQVVRLREQRRQLAFKFSSNASGGNYEAGNTIAHVSTNDGRFTQ